MEYNMKILVINGSPRGEGSCTMNLTNAFLEGAGWTDAEVIDMSKSDVKGCLGCFSCWSKTPGSCVINDNMTEFLPKIIEADVVIWSFPLYSCGFPGNMKNFMDRQLPIALPYMDKSVESGAHPSRYDMSKQRQFFISTCGFWTAEGNYDSIIALLKHGRPQVNHKDFTVFCGQGELFNVPELKEYTNPYLEIVRQAGKECISGVISKETSDLLAEPLFPREDFEKMADGSWDE